MFGFLVLLENLKAEKRYFLPIKAFVYDFHGESRHLSTRLLRANDSFEGTFLFER